MPPRFELAALEKALNDGRSSKMIESLVDTLAMKSFTVISLSKDEGTLFHNSLTTIGSALGRFHGCSPRFHECAGSNVSSWSRRVFMHYERTGGAAATVEGEKWPQPLATAVTSAADVDPVLVRTARAVTAALSLRTRELHEQSFTVGQFDAFFYPCDNEPASDDDEDPTANAPPSIESAEYDSSCPCPSHEDPGIITLVAETVAALEARATGEGPWERLSLGCNEICIVTGQQLAKLTAGRMRACRHRVALTAAARASLVFEIHIAGSLDPEEEEQDAGTASGTGKRSGTNGTSNSHRRAPQASWRSAKSWLWRRGRAVSRYRIRKSSER